MVSLGWYVLTAMLIVSTFAHVTENEGSSLEELIHLQNEHGKLLNKITQDIIGNNLFDYVQGDDPADDAGGPNYVP